MLACICSQMYLTIITALFAIGQDMHIKLSIELQTGSNKNVTGHMTYLESCV